MDLFSILSMIGGLALFLYGMSTMGDGLTKLSGGKLESILEKLTSKRIMAVLLGAMVTAVIQSSSATTVMVVGFVNSGIMKLSQAVGIIMGANIGTTITSWILSLTGIQSNNVWIRLCKPSSFSPILALIGILLYMSKGNNKKKDVGVILLGFAVLMFGMETMSEAVSPLSQNESFTSILTMFSNPVLGMLMGAVLTAIIQSSSASVGILQALCVTGAIKFNIAIPIIMGQNIGTCITAILSSVGANKNAKRAAMIHLYFNLIGTILFMVVFYSMNAIIHFDFLNTTCNAMQIAIIHSLFNIGCVIVLFPFANVLVKLSEITVKDKKEAISEKPSSLVALDSRFIEQPGFALELCTQAVNEMSSLSKESFISAMDVLRNQNEEKIDIVYALEEKVDVFEDTINNYLVKLSSKDLSWKESQTLTMLLQSIHDIERISDHSIDIVKSYKEMKKKNLHLTSKGQLELNIYSDAIHEILNLTFDVFKENNIEKAKEIEPLEETIDHLSKEMKKRHINRLKKGECSLETGMILEDIIINYERVSDHCSNIAIHLIQSVHEFDKHEYLSSLTSEDNEWFQKEYHMFKEVYALPE